MAFETPFKTYKSMEPSSSLEVLRDFFVDSVRTFETTVASKLASINHPRRSFLKPERCIQIEGVHPFVFTDSFGMKFVGREVVHVPPTDHLHYQVQSLVRWRRLVGDVDRRLVRRNEVGDWSLLTPLACLKEARPDLGLERGALLVPLREKSDDLEVFAPSFDGTLQPVLSQGKNFYFNFLPFFLFLSILGRADSGFGQPCSFYHLIFSCSVFLFFLFILV